MVMSRRQIPRSSGSRPNRSWAGATTSTYTTLGTASTSVITGFIATGGDQTILRVVGLLSITSDQAGAVEDQVGAFGMIIVSDVAFAAAIVPAPIAQQDDDGWFVYQAFSQQGDASVTSSLLRSYVIDSKAKRIVELEGRSVALVITNASASHGLKFALNLRILSQLRGTR